jgi:TolB-like protein/tetratricopeptide (TPR) repeat protein
MRCLEKRPADRPQTVSEIVHALDDITTPSGGTVPTDARLRSVSGAAASAAPLAVSPPRRDIRVNILVIAIAALVLAVAGLMVWKRPAAGTRVAATAARGAAIAVLPFENLGDSSEAYFADGMTDAVRGKLTGLSGMEVIARASSVQYRSTKKTPAEIARELGVRYLLTGTVRWAKSANGASHVQVSPELVEVNDNGTAASKWQQPFDAEMADVFRVQGEIAGKVADAMRVAVGGADQARLVEVPTSNSAAYDAFLRAEGMYWSTSLAPAELRRVVAAYEQSVRLDSGYAAAWAGLARARSLFYSMSTPVPELARQARAAADRALQLAPGAAGGHVALAVYFSSVEFDAARALPEIEAARALAPNDPDILGRLSSVYVNMGRFDEALQAARAAQQLDPRSLVAANRLRSVLFHLRRYREASAVADQALALGTNASTVQGRVMIALGQGDLAGARRIVSDAATRVNQDQLYAYMATYNDLGWALDDAGRRRLLAMGPEMFDDDRGGMAIARAHIYSWLGDSASARVWGDSAAREFALQLRAAPTDAQRQVLLGVSLAYAGRRSEALAAEKRGIELASAERDYLGAVYYDHQRARMHLLLGDRDKALDLVDSLLARPSHLSPGWLRVDPTFAALKGDPRFEKLVAGQ